MNENDNIKVILLNAEGKLRVEKTADKPAELKLKLENRKSPKSRLQERSALPDAVLGERPKRYINMISYGRKTGSNNR